MATFTQNAGKVQDCGGRIEMLLGQSGPGLKIDTPRGRSKLEISPPDMTLRVFKDLDSTMKDFVGVHMLMPQKSTSALTRFLHGNLRAKVYLSGTTLPRRGSRTRSDTNRIVNP